MIRLELIVRDVDASAELLDQLVRDLVQEIRQLDVGFASTAQGKQQARPQGAKGLADDLGHVIVELSTPTAAVAFAQVLREWLRRRQGRRITVTDDGSKKTIEITGPNDQQLQQFVEFYLRERDGWRLTDSGQASDGSDLRDKKAGPETPA